MLEKDATRLFVFSHPNHELAVMGLVRRLRPHMVFLTDGGGPERVDDTRRGLDSIGLLDNARFLNHTEGSFYDGLLGGNRDLFETVAAQVRESVEQVKPQQVFCDAVEFYNPVHDICLPIVRAAVRGLEDIDLFEIPLIYQAPGEEESYAVQRVPRSRRPVEMRLTDDELSAKCRARDTVYSNLRAQLGSVLASVPGEHIAVERVTPATRTLPKPDAERILRYEWRGKLLKSRGDIENVITYRDHYEPLAEALATS